MPSTVRQLQFSIVSSTHLCVWTLSSFSQCTFTHPLCPEEPSVCTLELNGKDLIVSTHHGNTANHGIMPPDSEWWSCSNGLWPFHLDTCMQEWAWRWIYVMEHTCTYSTTDWSVCQIHFLVIKVQGKLYTVSGVGYLLPLAASFSVTAWSHAAVRWLVLIHFVVIREAT